MPEQTADLLFELGTEELPAIVVEKFPKLFQEALVAEFFAQQITFKEIKIFSTPRRIGLIIEDLALQQPDRTIEKKGPAINQAFSETGALTAIGEGFARACGIDLETMKALRQQNPERLIYRMTQQGNPTKQLLPKIIENSIKKAVFGRTMYWGLKQDPFVRPVHWATLILGNEKIEGKLFGQTFVQHTFGHRFMAPGQIEIKNPRDYEKALYEHNVVANFETRKQIITNELNRLALQHSAKPLADEDLLNEVTGIVEWPVALMGQFDADFLTVPQEALITSMKVNQKCFPLVDEHGKLLPRFIMISNIASKDPARVVAGNEKVVRARLSDAKFFFEVDKKDTLASHLEKLKSIVFQAELGTLYDKTQRIKSIAMLLAQELQVNTAAVERAALLSKCDLTTAMVGEFPELQGTMGKYYAWNDNEPQEVSLAIEEHYLPRFAQDKLPETQEGQIVALADRFDTLLGLFGINKQPTGDKDPFALRRAAGGIVRLCVEQKLSFNIMDTLKKAFLLFNDKNLENSKAVSEVWQFISERLRVWYAEQGITGDIFNAVAATQCTNLVEFDQRVLAVKQFLTLPEAVSLSAANKRVANLLQKQEDKTILGKDIDVNLLELPSEITLAEALQEKALQLKPLYEQGDFSQALKSLSELQMPIDAFFDSVMVMVENANLRNNRLCLLNKARQLFLQIADISLL
jgi:glycyl-tRNA synthetase beta chain